MNLQGMYPAILASVLVAQTPAKPLARADLSAPSFTNSLGMKFTRIAAGDFTMGSADGKGETSERPAHKVIFATAFFMGVHEVTQAQWKAAMGVNPSKFPGDDHPVDFISWTDANAFVARLNELESGVNEYRLPSEAEWEYACRAGSAASYPCGEDESKLADYAWYEVNAGGAPQAVGKKKANAWGLFDMNGNTWEWCEDIWHDNYQGAPGDGSAWISGRDGGKHVIRGGSWAFGASDARSSARMAYQAESRVGDSLGLRVAVTPKK